MAIKKYYIETASSISDSDFNEDILDYGTGDYGIEVSFRGCSLIDEEISEALEENDEFIRAAEEEGYDTSFNEMSAFKVYLKLTKQHEDEIFIYRLDGLFETATGRYYSNLSSQASTVKNYLEDNGNIKVIESNFYGEFSFDYIVEFDDSMFNEVEDFLNRSNDETTSQNEEPSSFEYIEDHFNTPICKVTFRNVGCLKVTIREMQ